MSLARHTTAEALHSLMHLRWKGAAHAEIPPALPCPLADAEALASRAHHGQTRTTGDNSAPDVPYLVHPRAVVELLSEHPDPTARTPFVLAMAWLHDVLEDCDVSQEEMTAVVGADVCAGVRALSKSMRRTAGASKEDAQYWSVLAKAPLSVRRVKAADRIDNLRSCVRWQRPRLAAKYLLETPVFVLPLIADDAHLYSQLCAELANVRAAYTDGALRGALDH